MNLKVYQCFYLPDQRKFLDLKSFIPYDNTPNLKPELCERPIHEKLFQNHKNDSPDTYWGLVSWKWGQKLQYNGSFFIDWIKKNPGYDVYFIDPNMSNIAVFKNSFIKGDTTQPGILNFSQKLLDKLEININLLEDGINPNISSTCTYWVGNKKFWNKWNAFWNKCLQIIEEDPELKSFIYGYSRKTHIGQDVINYPFVYERFFSIFLTQEKKLKFVQYPFDSKIFHNKMVLDFIKEGKGSFVYYKLMYLIHKKILYCGDNLLVKMSDDLFGPDADRLPEF